MRSPPGADRRRSTVHRAACVATALLLGGCETLTRHGERVTLFAPDSHGAGESLVVARVSLSPGDGAGQRMLAEADLAYFGAGRIGAPQLGATRPLEVAPNRAASAAGWANMVLQPGLYVLRLRAANARPEGAERRFTISVPATPGTLYVGTFRIVCPTVPVLSGCRIEPEPADETEAAAAMLAAQNPAVGPPVRALARPYPPSLVALGLAPPTVPEIRVDASSWVAAINWDAVAASMRRPAEPPPAVPTSDAWPAEQARLRSVSMNFSGSGAEIIFLPAALVVALPIALVVTAIVRDQQRRNVEEAAREAEEVRRSFDVARSEWGVCANAIAATLAPDNVERHLRETVAPGNAAGRRSALPGPWRATVRRVFLRQCGEATGNHHGVEVSTRWTAQRAGEADPAFDAIYTRTVAGATLDPRLVYPSRGPWELPVATEAACRPLADYCGGAGNALLLREVVQGVTEARDAIAAGR